MFILTGVWFARKGILYEVNLQLEAYKSDTALTIMVLRPSCPSGKFLIRPGEYKLLCTVIPSQNNLVCRRMKE